MNFYLARTILNYFNNRFNFFLVIRNLEKVLDNIQIINKKTCLNRINRFIKRNQLERIHQKRSKYNKKLEKYYMI